MKTPVVPICLVIAAVLSTSGCTGNRLNVVVPAVAQERSQFKLGDRVRFMAQKVSPTRMWKVCQGDLAAAMNESDRFLALGPAARNALESGNTELAQELATELELLAPKYRDNGNAIQDANQVLGLIALSKGDIDEAKRRLLASADSNGSPTMKTFGPNMQLAKALLEKGEKDVVVDYFDRCGKFWKDRQLAAWKDSAMKGEVPDFGSNVLYGRGKAEPGVGADSR